LAGRFQVVPGKPAIVLDVGHNPQAVKVLADNLSTMGFFDRTYAVVGMLNDKDIAGALLPLKGKVDYWHVATLPGVRGTSAKQWLKLSVIVNWVGRSFVMPHQQAAMQAAKGLAAESDRILVFGSFLTVAGALEALRKKPSSWKKTTLSCNSRNALDAVWSVRLPLFRWLLLLPMVMDHEPRQVVQDVEIRIPGQDEKPFAPKFSAAPVEKSVNQPSDSTSGQTAD
jgi:hypothetical protein